MSTSANENLFPPSDDVEVGTFQGAGNTLDDRIAQEEPEDDRPREDIPYDRAPGSVGQLVAEPDDDGPEDRFGEQQDVYARAEGKPRDDVSAEESAIYLSDGYDAADLYGTEDDQTETPEDEEDAEADDETERRSDSAADFLFEDEGQDDLPYT